MPLPRGVDERAGCQTDPEPARLVGNRLDQGLDCFGGYMRSEQEKLNAEALNTLRFDWRLIVPFEVLCSGWLTKRMLCVIFDVFGQSFVGLCIYHCHRYFHTRKGKRAFFLL